MKENLLTVIKHAVVDGDAEQTRNAVKEALESGLDPTTVLEEGLTGGLQVMSARWDRLEVFLPEVLQSAAAMKAGFEALKPVLRSKENGGDMGGTVVIGTVKGDVHDIGKTVVATMLMGAGFEVLDLGVDQAPSRFVDSAIELDADIIGLSSLLTTTMPIQRDVIDLLESLGLRDQFLVLVGGAPTSEDWAETIGADGWGSDAYAAVRIAKSLMDGKRSSQA
jgi:corrinoid protein of di/trimethylamine methyltransferase